MNTKLLILIVIGVIVSIDLFFSSLKRIRDNKSKKDSLVGLAYNRIFLTICAFIFYIYIFYLYLNGSL